MASIQDKAVKEDQSQVPAWSEEDPEKNKALPMTHVFPPPPSEGQEAGHSSGVRKILLNCPIVFLILIILKDQVQARVLISRLLRILFLREPLRRLFCWEGWTPQRLSLPKLILVLFYSES